MTFKFRDCYSQSLFIRKYYVKYKQTFDNSLNNKCYNYIELKALKMRSRKFKLELPPFQKSVWIFIGYKKSFYKTASRLKFSKYTLSQIKKHDTEDCGAVFYTESGCPAVMQISTCNTGTLIHETNHLAYEILKYHGVEDSEMFAYYQEWLFKIIKKRL